MNKCKQLAMIDFFKKLFNLDGDDVDNYQYKGLEDIILTCSTLRGYEGNTNAIRQHEKFETQIKESDYYIVELTNIVKICQEGFDTPRMVKHSK